MTDCIAARLRTVQADVPQGQRLRIVPITGPSQDQPPYTLLDSQVQRSLQIAQTNDVGNVPGPKIVNPLDTRLFLMGGQTLPGAKQSCIVAADVLLCANASVSIPVSRVNERQAACARATFTEDKSTSRRTLASNLANTQPDRKLADRRSQLHPLDHTVGLAAFWNGHLLGLDLFDRHTTLRYYWDSLIDSYIDDLFVSESSATPTGNEAQLVNALLMRAAIGTWDACEAPGEGQNYHLLDTGLAGAALVWENQTVIHLKLRPRRLRDCQ